MCSIFQLKAGIMIPEEWFFNAVHNNEHGYGITMIDNGRMSTERGLPNPVDPDALYKKLKDNNDVERWVHLRNNSRGATNVDNIQPFTVLHSNKITLEFMHNGTITDYALSDAKYSEVELGVEPSDSRKYAFGKLAPLLARIKGVNLHDPVITELLSSSWGVGWGRAVILSSDGNHIFLGREKWDELQGEGGNFLASNDQYFKHLVRGTLYDQRKKEREEELKKNINSGVRDRVPIAGRPDIYQIPSLPTNSRELSVKVQNLLHEYDMYTPEGYIAMANFTAGEIEDLFKGNPEDATTMFMYLTSILHDNMIETEGLREKNEKATKLIATLKANGGVHVG